MLREEDVPFFVYYVQILISYTTSDYQFVQQNDSAPKERGKQDLPLQEFEELQLLKYALKQRSVAIELYYL